MDNSKATHVDYFIDHGSMGGSSEEEKYARWVLNHFRLPAPLQKAFEPFMKEYKLFCEYEGKKYRVTGASRLGDIYLHEDFSQYSGYILRVNIQDCSTWSREEGEIREVKENEITKEMQAQMDQCVGVEVGIRLGCQEREKDIINEDYIDFYGKLEEPGISSCVLTFANGERSFGSSTRNSLERLPTVAERREQAKQDAILNIVCEYF